jgi:hypothetical protein
MWQVMIGGEGKAAVSRRRVEIQRCWCARLSFFGCAARFILPTLTANVQTESHSRIKTAFDPGQSIFSLLGPRRQVSAQTWATTRRFPSGSTVILVRRDLCCSDVQVTHAPAQVTTLVAADRSANDHTLTPCAGCLCDPAGCISSSSRPARGEHSSWQRPVIPDHSQRVEYP